MFFDLCLRRKKKINPTLKKTTLMFVNIFKDSVYVRGCNTRKCLLDSEDPFFKSWTMSEVNARSKKRKRGGVYLRAKII